MCVSLLAFGSTKAQEFSDELPVARIAFVFVKVSLGQALAEWRTCKTICNVCRTADSFKSLDVAQAKPVNTPDDDFDRQRQSNIAHVLQARGETKVKVFGSAKVLPVCLEFATVSSAQAGHT